MHKPQRQSHLIFALLLATLLILPILSLLSAPSNGAESSPGGDASSSMTTELSNTWKAGLIEGAYLFNPHLSTFDIATRVRGDTAVIEGTVSTRTERALAEQVALSITGIERVENKLDVSQRRKNPEKNASENLTTDAALTTKVKSQLLANAETRGMDIQVNTQDQVVTLSGQVDSEVESELAYYVAKNTGGVGHVSNELQVKQ